jgi:FtsZ-binding cell division protein ZapB
MEKTKIQLLQEIASLKEANDRLQKTVNDHAHLASAVDAKDKEIGTLSQQMSTKWQKQIEEKENIIKVLVAHIQNYQQAFRSFLKNTQGGLENAVELEALLTDQLNKK